MPPLRGNDGVTSFSPSGAAAVLAPCASAASARLRSLSERSIASFSSRASRRLASSAWSASWTASDWPVSSFSLAQTLSTTSVIGSSGRRFSRSLAFDRSSSTLEASFFERIGQAVKHSHSNKRREVWLNKSGRELRGIDAVDPFPWEMFEGIGGQVRLRRSVEFFVGHALNAGRVAQPLLILVEAAPFVFLAATARTGFVAAGSGNGAAHCRG